jgi:prevent-host-death family protein
MFGMLSELPSLEQLPRQNATQVKNKWGDVVRQVQQMGSVAVTSHATVEMVLVDAAAYQKLASEIAALNAREQSVLDALTNRFNTRLAALQQPGAGDKLNAVFAARGKLVRRPKAGASF